MRSVRGLRAGADGNAGMPGTAVRQAAVAGSCHDVRVSAFSSLQATRQTPRRPGVTTPRLRFLRTETAGAGFLLGATVVALAWANLAPGNYESVWHTHLSLTLGSRGCRSTCGSGSTAG